MKYATLAQGQKVLQAIVKKRLPTDQLQRILSMGLLDDLLDAHLDEVDRTELRTVLGLRDEYVVRVDYTLATEDACAAFCGKKMDFRRCPELVDMWGNNTGIIEVKMATLRFKNRYVHLEHAMEEMAKRGLRPANLRETLALVDHMRSNLALVALGSHTKAGFKFPIVRTKHEREIGVVPSPWGDECRFAAVHQK